MLFNAAFWSSLLAIESGNSLIYLSEESIGYFEGSSLFFDNFAATGLPLSGVLSFLDLPNQLDFFFYWGVVVSLSNSSLALVSLGISSLDF